MIPVPRILEFFKVLSTEEVPYSLFDDVINVFLYEEYTDIEKPLSTLRWYYRIKSFIPRPLQIYFRRIRAMKILQDERKFPAWPIDLTLEKIKVMILKDILGTDHVDIVWFWPDGKQFAFVLTHDVETKGGVARVQKFMEVEMKYNFRSSFNFVPYKYDVPEGLIEELETSGFEVAVHGYNHDGRLFLSREEFDRRMNKIYSVKDKWKAVGFRSPSTLRRRKWIEEINFKWDSSYLDTDPFEPQGGGCLSLYPFTLGKLIELPNTLPQDHLLFRMLGYRDFELWKNKINIIEKMGGMALLNVHPDPGYMGDDDLFPIYEDFLGWLSEKTPNVWNALPQDVADWWLKRLYYDPGDGEITDPFEVRRLDLKLIEEISEEDEYV